MANQTEDLRLATAIEGLIKTRVALSQREIDTNLTLLQGGTGAPMLRSAAIRQLTAEFDRVRKSDYHLEFEVDEEGFESFEGMRQSTACTLALRTEPDGNHIVGAISSKEGGSIATSYQVFNGEPKINFSWVSDSVHYGVHQGELAVKNISAIRIVKTPASKTPTS